MSVTRFCIRSYRQDLKIFPSPAARISLVLLAVFLLTLPLFGGRYIVFVAGVCGVSVISALALNILTGYTGLISLGHAAFMGIGAPRRDSILIRRGTIVDWEELSALKSKGAVGDINLRYFDIDGMQIASALNDRVIGLTLDEIHQIETVVGVAGGEAKYYAIQGAVRGQLVDVLVTDDATARRLLEESSE